MRREWLKRGPEDAIGQRAFTDRYAAAMDALRTPELIAVEDAVSDTAKRMLGFLGRDTIKDVAIGFGFADPTNPFSSLRVEYREGDLTVPGDQLGLGTQSAIVVGIFEALRQLHGPIGTLMIEEPELALHPQAQRYFHRILTELADREGCQVIYSTHSPTFADATRFESVRLLRRAAGQHTKESYVAAADDMAYLEQHRDTQGLSRDMDASRSELLFAERVLLVEGPGDVWAAREVATKLGIDLDGQGLSVVSCGSKTSIPFFARFCVALGIDFLVMHDEDIYEPADALARDNGRQQKANTAITEAMRGNWKRFALQPTLEDVLGVGRQASNKPRRVREAVQAASIDALPAQLVGAVKLLADIPPF